MSPVFLPIFLRTWKNPLQVLREQLLKINQRSIQNLKTISGRDSEKSSGNNLLKNNLKWSTARNPVNNYKENPGKPLIKNYGKNSNIRNTSEKNNG